jgi:LysM repeat protein
MFARILVVALLATFFAWSLLARSSDGAGKAQVYVVKPGDSLWSIAARRYGGDPRAGVWRLEERNGLVGTTIAPGQRLLIP